jgi:hypothetical protein
MLLPREQKLGGSMKIFADKPWHKNLMAVLAILGGIAGVVYGVIQILESPVFKPKKVLNNIEIVVDSSQGMGEIFKGSTKWEAALSAVDKALDEVAPDDNLSLRHFGGPCHGQSTELLVEFDTHNKEALRKALQGIAVDGQTTLLRAIVEATGDFNDLYRFSGVRKSIIVITGGGNLCYQDAADRIRLRLKNMANVGAPIDVSFRFIGMGLTSKQKEEFEKIASETGGRVEFAETPQELQDKLSHALWEIQIGKFTHQNLVKNPGAEDELKHWVVPRGYTRRQSHPPPQSGKYYFFAGANKSVAEAKQSIDLSQLASIIDTENVECEIASFMRNYQGGDLSELEVSFLLGNGELALQVTSGPINSAHHWTEFHSRHLLPAKVRTAQVVLRSTYRHGAENNDGYFDDIYVGCSEKSWADGG